MTAEGQLAHLSAERIWKELEKALRFPDFPRFVQTARACGALEAVLPEVNRLWNTPERTDYHLEGNSGDHTLSALEQAAGGNALVRFGILLHDIGKTVTPAEILPSHHNHEQNGLEIIRTICRRLKLLQLKKEDFARAPLPAGEAGKLLTFWQWLKQKDFDRCRQLNVYFCGVLLYRIKTRPDGSRSDHLLFGALPFFSRRRRAVQK